MNNALASLDDMEFIKGHGTENDFVLFFDPEGALVLTEENIQAVCDRRAGIGADGVIRAVFLGKADVSQDVATGVSADTWFMDYRNADGSLAEMCGNGARVFAAFLEHHTGVDLSEGLKIATRAGERVIRAHGGGDYSVSMGTSTITSHATSTVYVEARGLEGRREATSASIGNFHTVVQVNSIHELEALDLSVAPRVTPTPEEETNVEFMVIEGPGRVRMRVHERGVGETRSCGTGACAAAIVAAEYERKDSPPEWVVAVPGGQVSVTIRGDETVLKGPARLVADGIITASAPE